MDISRFPVRVHKSGAGGLGHCAQCDVGGGLSQRVSALGAFLGGELRWCRCSRPRSGWAGAYCGDPNRPARALLVNSLRSRTPPCQINCNCTVYSIDTVTISNTVTLSNRHDCRASYPHLQHCGEAGTTYPDLASFVICVPIWWAHEWSK